MDRQLVKCASCGKEVVIKRYGGNINPYTCSNCRKVSHKLFSCIEIILENFIKKFGFKIYFCRKIHSFVSIKNCKHCKV
jgi:hypothetical protein